MHTVGLVLGENPEQQLEKFADYFEVDAFKKYMDEDEIQDMADEYGIDARNVVELREKVKKWLDYEGFVENGRLGYFCNENPNAKFDWYTIGGRWKGYLKLGIKKVNKNDVADQARFNEINIDELTRDVPGFVLKNGQWHEDHLSLSELLEGKVSSEWRSAYEKILKEMPGDTLVTVIDIHS